MHSSAHGLFQLVQLPGYSQSYQVSPRRPASNRNNSSCCIYISDLPCPVLIPAYCLLLRYYDVLISRCHNANQDPFIAAFFFAHVCLENLATKIIVLLLLLFPDSRDLSLKWLHDTLHCLLSLNVKATSYVFRIWIKKKLILIKPR